MHCDEALAEMTAGDGRGGALLAFQRKFVDGFARDAFHSRDRIGADALIGLRMHRTQVQVAVSNRGGPSLASRRFGIDIISVPPATTRSAMPAMMLCAAMFTVVMPEPQKRSSVTPLLVTS